MSVSVRLEESSFTRADDLNPGTARHTGDQVRVDSGARSRGNSASGIASRSGLQECTWERSKSANGQIRRLK